MAMELILVDEVCVYGNEVALKLKVVFVVTYELKWTLRLQLQMQTPTGRMN
jgi:hypothetical protein